MTKDFEHDIEEIDSSVKPVENRSNSIMGNFQTVTTAPTGTPTSWIDQVQIYIEDGSSVLAGSFISGTSYRILSVGTTDFTAIGAVENRVGVNFVATGTGSGSGAAIPNISRLYWYDTVANAWHYVTETI